jgi:hypothetical protein
MFTASRVGIFLISFSLLFLEILSTRVFACVVGSEYIFFTVALAMLGLGAAGTFSSLTRPIKDVKNLHSRISRISWMASFATLLIFLGTAKISHVINSSIVSDTFNLFDFYQSNLKLNLLAACVVGFIMSLSYFFHGYVLSLFFKNLDRRQVHLFYAFDLLGACVGAFLAIILLESGGYWLPLGVAISAPILASAAFNVNLSKSKAAWITGIALAIVAVLAFSQVHSKFEPESNIKVMARMSGEEKSRSARELAHWWTSYGRIGAIEITNEKGLVQTVMVHGMGEGHARVVPFPSIEPPSPIRVLYGAELAVAGCKADRVLILLSGPGTELVLIDQITKGKSELTGVEMISKVVEWPIAEERFRLNEFLANPKNKIEIAEAREFLARDKTKYDCILVSWSGASRSYYTGGSVAAPNNVYTQEGIKALLDHLTPDGQLTLLDANKVRLALAVRNILLEKGTPSIGDKLVIIGDEKDRGKNPKVQRRWWDTQNGPKLLVKPGGFTHSDLDRIREISDHAEWEMLYDPFQLSSDAPNFWQKMIHSEDPMKVVAPEASAHGVDVSVSTDDKPFVFDLSSPMLIFTKQFWLGKDGAEMTGSTKVPEGIRVAVEAKRRTLYAFLLFCLVSILLIIAPVMMRHSNNYWSPGLVKNVMYFGVIGAGFMLIEMGMIQKFRLLIGHPGYTLGIVLASIVFFAGVGSWISGPLFGSGRMSITRAALLVTFTTVLSIGCFELFSDHLLELPREVKILIAFLFPSIPSIFLGQLFPQGLALLAKFDHEVPILMAVNAFTGTIASGVGLLLAPIIGFNSVIFLGAFLYILIGISFSGTNQNSVKTKWGVSLDQVQPSRSSGLKRTSSID